MANQDHLGIFMQGWKAWNLWRQENPGVRPDLNEAELTGLDVGGYDLTNIDLKNADLSHVCFHTAYVTYGDLRKANLRYTRFSGTDLRWANLSNAKFNDADLYRVSLDDAVLCRADFRDANLHGTHLRRTDLREADLRDANLSAAFLEGADLSEAFVAGTVFGDVDLSEVKGLESVRHSGRSTIGTDTIHLSKGKIPEVFLRSCGLKDWEIEAAKLYSSNLTPGQASEIVYKIHELRTNPAIQFNSCFLSHSSKDLVFAKELQSRLQDSGVRCWFAPEDIKIGDKFRQRIDEAIRLHDKLLVILSENSISSAWVEEEVESALERERRESRLVLFPIRIDEAVMRCDQAWAALLRRMRHIGDFSKWKDQDSYSQALARLLRDLKSENKE